ncbi:MAG: hypothetical protein NW237_03760 [Cyanobacteriota bacterium]|nr:hypothetical protein [Cyanobacteriota bacterium]
MPKKPKKTSLPLKAAPIKATAPPSFQGVSFSFRYLDSHHPKFSVNHKDIHYLIALLERWRSLCSQTALELKQSRSPALRCHPIDWDDPKVSESSFGIPNQEQLVDIPYQIAISANEHGRLHGFFIKEVFYVVWMDPDHNLYP